MTYLNSGFDPEFAAAADWARLYRANGVQIVPCKNKIPRLKSWKEYQNALVPDAQFEAWYGHGGEFAQSYDMGALTGTASGRMLMIDLDVYKAGGEAARRWWDGVLEVNNNGLEPETWKQITGGGGVQLFFTYPPDWKFAVNAKTDINVDIRCQGGFAVLPPTRHASGGTYIWVDGNAPWEIPIALAPDWLLAEVEKLIREHGGGAGAGQAWGINGNEKQQPKNSEQLFATGQHDAQYDAFGHQTDGRETKMRDLVWGAVVDWYRECPIKPTEGESTARAGEKYLIYEALVSPRVNNVTMTKTQLLDQEGRGPAAFWFKWLHAMALWDTKVAEEAKKPGKEKTTHYDYSDEFKAEPKIDPATGQPLPLILTAEQFVAGFTPPAYLIDGIIQRGYLYSLTARTGHGKTAVAMYIAQCLARGEPMHGCAVKQGTVLLLAGENPDDIRARFLVLAEAYGFNPETIKMRFIAGVIDLPSRMAEIQAEAEQIDDLMLVIVDTAAAYFPGDETNSNSQQGAYARGLRLLTFLPGKPAVLVNCHPVKNAARDNLLPMGGSAFLNEVDGNLTLWANAEKQTSLHWLGKFRGPEFNPVAFEIVVATSDRVQDAEGRLMPNAVAKPISDDILEAAERVQETDEDRLLHLIYDNDRASLATLALKMGAGKSKVQRIADRLKSDKLIEIHRNRYRLTSRGRKEIGVGEGNDDE